MQHLAETHPTPQFARPEWTSLCGEWRFALDPGGDGLVERWIERRDVFDRTITVPFPPESAASGIDDPGPHRVVWYRREFRHEPLDGNERLLLHFGAVDSCARVWINGHLVLEHEGGHTPISADISEALTDSGPQVVVVRAEDDPFDLYLPRGKQDWQTPPHGIWYKRTTGIWQPVWLERVPTIRIDELRWTPDVSRGAIGLQVSLNTTPPQPMQLVVRLTRDNAVVAEDQYRITEQDSLREIILTPGGSMRQVDDMLWSPESPTLIDASVELRDDDVVIDRVMSYVGFRSIELSNGTFKLNNRAYFLRLVLEQGYWPESHLAAPSDEALRHEVELVKSLGFNGVRIHQKVEDPRFLYWCDRLGLLVWGEMANAYGYSTRAVERLVREWLDVVRRDYSHPSIVAWVPLNESWGVPALQQRSEQRHYLRALYHLTRSVDPTRPVITNDGWEHVESDILGVHDYSFDGKTLRERYRTREQAERTIREVQPGQHPIALEDADVEGRPIMITEYGGISFAPDRGERWFGYGTVGSAEEYLAKYDELTSAILDSEVVAGYCYTQLTDTEQETNGLLTADRVPKLDVERIREINTRPAASIPRETTAAHRRRAQTGAGQGTDGESCGDQQGGADT